MNRIRKSLLVLLLSGGLMSAGCATVGQDFDTQHVDDIRIGKTSRSDIQALLGEPWRTGVEDGKRTWTYGKYRWSAFGDAQTTDLVVRFDKDGTVSSYVYNTTENTTE